MRFRAEQFYARADLKRAIIYNPFEYRYHFMIANMFARLSLFRQAKAHYRIVLALRPNYLDAAANLAAVQAKTGLLANAKGVYEAVLRMSPKHPEARNGLNVVNKLQEAKNEKAKLVASKWGADEPD